MKKYLLLSACYITFVSTVYAGSIQIGDLQIEFTKKDEKTINLAFKNLGKTTMKPIKYGEHTIDMELKPNKILTTTLTIHKDKPQLEK